MGPKPTFILRVLVIFAYLALGFRGFVYTPSIPLKMENQMEKEMENEMETGII